MHAAERQQAKGIILLITSPNMKIQLLNLTLILDKFHTLVFVWMQKYLYQPMSKKIPLVSNCSFYCSKTKGGQGYGLIISYQNQSRDKGKGIINTSNQPEHP